MTSPTSPGGSSAPAGSTIRSSVPGRAWPHEASSSGRPRHRGAVVELGEVGEPGRGLGLPEALVEVAAEHLHGPHQRGLGDGRAAVGHGPQRRVGAVGHVVDGGEAGLDHGGDERGEGDVVVGQRVDHGPGVEALLDDEAPTTGDTGERGDHGSGVEQGRHDQPPVTRLHRVAEPGADLRAVGEHAAVGEQDALGQPGRAARVHLVEHVVGLSPVLELTGRAALEPGLDADPAVGTTRRRRPPPMSRRRGAMRGAARAARTARHRPSRPGPRCHPR